MKNTLKQNQVLKQKLSHQNIQLFKMIEMNLLQFEQKVKEELDDNPALENLDHIDTDQQTSLDKILEAGVDNSDAQNIDNEEYYIDNYTAKIASDVESYEEKFHESPNMESEDRDLYVSVEDHESIIDNLLNQVRYFDLTDEEYKIAEYIIGNLDEDGYLRRDILSIEDDLAFRNNILVSNTKI
ncbi:MAG: hypothetical protein ACOVP5_07750, partial [Chitinophagales bacterium]